MEITLTTFLQACNKYGINIKGGVIHDFIRLSYVKYYGGKCSVYQVEFIIKGARIVLGGNYATNSKPKIEIGERLDF